MSAEDMTAAVITALDNDDVIAKLASALSVTINLIFAEKLNPIMLKLDTLISDNKALQTKVLSLEHENTALKDLFNNRKDVEEELHAKINFLEQHSRRNNLVITGVKETYAERASPATTADEAQPENSREDTIASVCAHTLEAHGCQVFA